ncbi:MAG: AmmeMemoRadiSam system protein A [Deltaproteobacteria bacterium]|nr:AmmeMemoRadiSam system protein A [Candidatus Anaeroferrophillacea bacterium]
MSGRAGIDLGLSPAEKDFLRALARQEIAARLGRDETPPVPPTGAVHLAEKRGAFVTLTRAGRLRGCIGYIRGYKPLTQTIREMAVAAAFQDPRFPPLAAAELAEIGIEISVLTPLEKVADPAAVEVGRDGLYIECDGAAGLLLPQVAVEHGWDRNTFLTHTCIKAGLAGHCWKLPQAEIYRFSADIF